MERIAELVVEIAAFLGADPLSVFDLLVKEGGYEK